MTRYRPMVPAGIALSSALLLALCAGRAAAQQQTELSPAGAPRENVWSKGVPEEARRAADALFKEGNRLLKESIVIAAAAKYREALTHWDHPNIHYNLALALMNLDQPVETREHLVAAMRYGPEPLERERYEHARNYLGLLEKQLARIQVRCDVPGARVELDGQTLFVPPGTFEGHVRAGRHTLVASKEGLVTNQSVRDFAGGTAAVIDLPLKTERELTRSTRRWAAWVPWSVVGAGAGVVIAGGALQYGAAQKVDWIDSQAAVVCPGPAGCPTEPPALAEERKESERMETAAVVAYAVGGAAVATGAVLAYLNRARTYVLPYEDAAGAPRQASLEVAPVLDPGRPGVVATLRF